MEYINARVVPAGKIRFRNLGDWRTNCTVRSIEVADMGNEDYEFLLILHEMVEQHLCLKHGVSEQAVDKWDSEHLVCDEPGDDPESPYHREHHVAMTMERLMAAFLGVNWNEYEAKLEAVDGTH